MIRFETDFYEKLFMKLDNNSVILRVDADGVHYPIWCSREFTQMIQGSAEAFIEKEGKHHMSTIHPDDREDVSFLFKNHITRDGRNSLTFRKYTLQDKLIWVNMHYAFVEHNGVRYAYCNYTDVTELKESQEQTMVMYEGLNRELHMMADDNLVSLRANLTRGIVEEVRGYDLYNTDRPGADVHELMKIRMEHMPVEEDRRKFQEAFQLEHLRDLYYQGLYEESLVLFEERHSGRQCFIKHSISVRKDPVTGDLIVLCIETEYNSQKVTEVLNDKVLAKQYDMVSYIVSGNYGVAIGDASLVKQGSIFPKRHTGVYMDYIREQVLPVAVGEEREKQELLRALSLETIEEKLSEEEPYTVDLSCRIDGEIFHKRLYYYAVDRENRFYILLKSDITEVLKQQSRSHQQLADALKEANQANVAKTAFLSNMSHEIRTPMNAIIGLSNIALQDATLSESTREHLEKLGGSAKHLLSLINDVLDMSRIESGRMLLKNEPFPFKDLLNQISVTVQSQCRDKGLAYKFSIGGDVDDCYIGDESKLKQALMNILENAVKFTPVSGSVSFLVKQTAQYGDQTTIRFVIRDTGIGMDEEYLPRIFEPFSQEDGTTTNAYGGSGLGLALTKNIVEMMNGNIMVRSWKGQGSEFTVNVTLKTSQEQPKLRKQETEQAFEFAGRRILIAEDVMINAEILKEILRMKGLVVEHAENGKLAVEMFQRSEPGYYDAVLMDVRMPVLDGLGATEQIRSLPRADAGQIPVIAMTANAFDEDVQRSLQAGMNAHLTKPVDPALLFDTLELHIRRAQGD